jgi:hypothetical protein
MKAIHRTLVLLAALVFMVAASAQAQDKPGAPGAGPGAPGGAAQAGSSASGELTDVDASAMTITVKTATSDMKIKYDAQTKVSGAQKGVAGLATAKGSEVTVQYHKEGADNIATSIVVKGGADKK